MFRGDSKIGFRFNRETEDAGSDDGRQTPLKSALQATSAEIARETLLERARPPALPAPGTAAGTALAGQALVTGPGPMPGLRTRQTEGTVLPPVPRGEHAPRTEQAPRTEPVPRAETTPIIAQAKSVINQAPGDDEARSLDQVLRSIETIAARQMEQERELRRARDLADKAVADRARLQEENQQLRDLLTALMKTVETERRRRSETVGRIGDRLKSLTASMDPLTLKDEAA